MDDVGSQASSSSESMSGRSSASSSTSSSEANGSSTSRSTSISGRSQSPDRDLQEISYVSELHAGEDWAHEVAPLDTTDSSMSMPTLQLNPLLLLNQSIIQVAKEEVENHPVPAPTPPTMRFAIPSVVVAKGSGDAGTFDKLALYRNALVEATAAAALLDADVGSCHRPSSMPSRITFASAASKSKANVPHSDTKLKAHPCHFPHLVSIPVVTQTTVAAMPQRQAVSDWVTQAMVLLATEDPKGIIASSARRLWLGGVDIYKIKRSRPGHSSDDSSSSESSDSDYSASTSSSSSESDADDDAGRTPDTVLVPLVMGGWGWAEQVSAAASFLPPANRLSAQTNNNYSMPLRQWYSSALSLGRVAARLIREILKHSSKAARLKQAADRKGRLGIVSGKQLTEPLSLLEQAARSLASNGVKDSAYAEGLALLSLAGVRRSFGPIIKAGSKRDREEEVLSSYSSLDLQEGIRSHSAIPTNHQLRSAGCLTLKGVFKLWSVDGPAIPAALLE